MEALEDAQKRIGASILLVGHDIALMAQFTDRVGVMYAGRLVGDGAGEGAVQRASSSIHPTPYRQSARFRAEGGVQGHTRPYTKPPQPSWRVRFQPSVSSCDGSLSSGDARAQRGRPWPMGIMLPTLDRDEPPLLEARKLTKVYSGGGLSRRKRKTVALEDFSLAIGGDRPVFIGVAGESGSGKTTLVRLLLGFIKPTSGEVLYKGNNIWDMSRAARQTFRHEVQAIFQDPYEVYNPFYKVDHVLATPISKFHLARNKIEARQLVAEALETVGLRPDEILGRYPHQLSGGQRQRIMVARALLIGSRIIIADEPVSMVDASLRATIMESIQNLHREFGISVIYVTHDLTTAYQICQSIIVLLQGLWGRDGGCGAGDKGSSAPLYQAPDGLDTRPRSGPQVDS